MKLKIAISIILAILAVANFLFLILGMISALTFWVLTIIFAFFAYIILPKIKMQD